MDLRGGERTSVGDLEGYMESSWNMIGLYVTSLQLEMLCFVVSGRSVGKSEQGIVLGNAPEVEMIRKQYPLNKSMREKERQLVL